MAERLTEKDKYGNNAIFQKKFTIAKDKNNDIRVYGKAIDKLAQLEDIMEEYGMVDIQDFKDCLESMYDESINAKKLKEFKDIMEKYDIESVEELEKKLSDSDTWKRACELACKRICYMLDQEMQYHEHEKFNSEEYLKTEIDYFYQQAKKDGENETNISGQN